MKVQGTIARIAVVPDDHGHNSLVTLLLVGDNTLYEGRTINSSKLGLDILKLSAPGDQVSFEYEVDFNTYMAQFVNTTMDALLV